MKKETDPLRILNRATLFAEKKSPRLISANMNGEIQASVESLSIDLIESKGNPRKSFDKETLSELAGTMKDVGLLQPILVRGKGSKFELIAGERRLRAAKMLGWKTIPAIVKSVDELDPEKISSAKILENLQREDLSKEELSLAVSELANSGYSQAEIAKTLGKSKQWVSQKVQHAGLIKEFPKASQLDSTTASRIVSQDRKYWRELVEEAISKPGSRSNVIESISSKKAQNNNSKSLDLNLDSLKKKLTKINEKISALQLEKNEIQEQIKKLKAK